MRFLVLGALLLSGCSYFQRSHSANPTSQDTSPLKAKYTTYLALSKKNLDKYGFVNPDKCDSVKFTGYYIAAGGSTDILQAESQEEPGRFYRHAEHDCYPGGAPSSFDRDMALGLGHALWATGKPEVAQRFMDYTDSHGGRVGEGDLLSTDLRPGLITTYHAIINRSAGVPIPPRPTNPDPSQTDPSTSLTGIASDFPAQTGYEAELTVSHILLRGLIYGALNQFELDTLTQQTQRQPRNAFYQAVLHKFTDGNQGVAIATLMDESLFPAEQLPTIANFCTPYLWQRDDTPKDWGPCADAGVVMSGADFLFAAAVVLGDLRQAP